MLVFFGLNNSWRILQYNVFLEKPVSAAGKREENLRRDSCGEIECIIFSPEKIPLL